MADLNEAYKFVKEDELKKALRNILLYCRFDTAENLTESVEVVEKFLQEKPNEK
jgi:vacuolar-type H+-ATPase subunit C/Vma6